jgi:hypothetical protein
MRKFRVLVIGHQLKNQVIAKFGNLVNEDQLNGNAQALVDGKFIEEVFEDANEIDVDLLGKNDIDLSEMTKAELIVFASDNDLDVNPANKKEYVLNDIISQIKK